MMRRKFHKNRWLSLLLAGAMLLNLLGCGAVAEDPQNGTTEPETQSSGTPVAAMDLMEEILAKAVSGKKIDEKFVDAVANFSVKLFQNYKLAEGEKVGENVLISPLSALLALAMTANGADGQTLREMETVLAGGMPIEELNQYLYTYTHSLPSEEKAKFEIANSIWFRSQEGFKVQPEFLQTNADYYGAAARKEPFDDGTKDAINGWVNENTDGLIEEIISSPIPADTVMYLINAIVFDAKWAREYSLSDIYERDFTAADGTVKKVSMMWSEESKYLDDGSAVGFVKPYAGGAYSFAALLPDEGVDIHEYIASMTGERLLETLSGVESASVSASLPKFSYEDETLMNEELMALGMPTAFSSAADFTDMAQISSGYLYIGNVLQKTFIAVDELGTKAGAVTSVEMTTESIQMYQYTVRLDRPFVYLIIDNATNLPIFIGAVMDIEE